MGRGRKAYDRHTIDELRQSGDLLDNEDAAAPEEAIFKGSFRKLCSSHRRSSIVSFPGLSSRRFSEHSVDDEYEVESTMPRQSRVEKSETYEFLPINIDKQNASTVNKSSSFTRTYSTPIFHF